MAIILDEKSRVIIQGITGGAGRIFAEKFRLENTKMVAGVSPGRKGASVAGVPVLGSVEESVAVHGANTSLVTVPPQFATDAILEAVDAGIKTIIIYVEGIPVRDTCKFLELASAKGVTVIGPNAAGIVSPGKCNVSDINPAFIAPGHIGVVSKSGSLSYEILISLKRIGLGMSTICCIGGDPVIGTDFVEILSRFEQDPDTHAITLLGEVGGTQEIEAAKYISKMQKRVFAFINGHTVPPNRRIGHAGAIVTKADESAQAKTDILRNSGATTANSFAEFISRVGNWTP